MERKTLEIYIDWVAASGNPSFNSLVIKELKAKGIDFEYDHFFNLRAHDYDLKVNEHTKVEDRVRFIKSFESLENDVKKNDESNIYAEAVEKANEEIGKDTLKEDSAKIVTDMAKEGQENSIKENVKSKEKPSCSNDGRD